LKNKLRGMMQKEYRSLSQPTLPGQTFVHNLDKDRVFLMAHQGGKLELPGATFGPGAHLDAAYLQRPEGKELLNLLQMAIKKGGTLVLGSCGYGKERKNWEKELQDLANVLQRNVAAWNVKAENDPTFGPIPSKQGLVNKLILNPDGSVNTVPTWNFWSTTPQFVVKTPK
jgi:hypothetical protein